MGKTLHERVPLKSKPAVNVQQTLLFAALLASALVFALFQLN
ncbi:hypothetical protein [Noviherbaspirillum galbum]|nr:hypothetical protein [Noviherbaspirillum galbum]